MAEGAASATGGSIGREKSNYDWSTAIEAIAWDITRPFFPSSTIFLTQKLKKEVASAVANVSSHGAADG